MIASPEQLYLDLLKKTLLSTLWPEPPIPFTLFNAQRPPLKRAIYTAIATLLGKRKLQLVKQRTMVREQRLDGQGWPGNAHTLLSVKRLDNLQQCVESILREEVPGDLIETGVWRGGACIFMRAILAAYGDQTRKVFVADSFEGLPKPDLTNYPADTYDFSQMNWLLAVSDTEVEENFRNYGLFDEQVVFLKGWFKDTLPQAPIEKLALLRLDGDLYESTMDALTHLYPKLSPGGFCLIDDYGLPSCRAAVDDYRASHGIEERMKAVDWTGIYWQKAA